MKRDVRAKPDRGSGVHNGSRAVIAARRTGCHPACTGGKSCGPRRGRQACAAFCAGLTPRADEPPVNWCRRRVTLKMRHARHDISDTATRTVAGRNTGVDAMKMTKIALLLALLAPSMTGQAMTAVAAEAGKDVKGLYLLTDYPAVSVRPGTTSTISLAPAELRPSAGALRAVGRWRAGGLDRDAARRRPAGGRRDAGDRPERQPAAAPRRAGRRGPRHQDPDRQGGRRGQQSDAADHRQPRQGAAGKAGPDAAAAVAARHPEIELRLYDRRQERLRPQSHGEPRRQGAAEFRNLVHRGLWQPGTVLGADRCRRFQGREAQGAAAIFGRCRQFPGRGHGQRRRRARPRRS